MLSCSVLLLSRLPTEFDVATDVETPLEIARSDDAPSTTDGAHPLRRLGVTLGDWRALHAVLWELELCGVPRSPNENVSYTDAPTGDLAAHYGWAVDAFGNLLGVS